MPVPVKRLPLDSGIAIGPILFVLALLAIIGTVLASGGSGFNVASVSDRVYNDVYTQTNLIRSKINECNLKYGTDNNGDGYPASDNAGTPVCALKCIGDDSSAITGNDCQGNAMTEQNLWYGIRPTVLPPPTSGLNQWYYVNGGTSGGRCIWVDPVTASTGVVTGLSQAAVKFSSQEIIYNANGTTHRFVIWISYPTGTPNVNCVSS